MCCVDKIIKSSQFSDTRPLLGLCSATQTDRHTQSHLYVCLLACADCGGQFARMSVVCECVWKRQMHVPYWNACMSTTRTLAHNVQTHAISWIADVGVGIHTSTSARVHYYNNSVQHECDISSNRFAPWTYVVISGNVRTLVYVVIMVFFRLDFFGGYFWIEGVVKNFTYVCWYGTHVTSRNDKRQQTSDRMVRVPGEKHESFVEIPFLRCILFIDAIKGGSNLNVFAVDKW